MNNSTNGYACKNQEKLLDEKPDTKNLVTLSFLAICFIALPAYNKLGWIDYSRGYKKRAISGKLCHTLHERQSYFK
jgi:hypothetical protein